MDAEKAPGKNAVSDASPALHPEYAGIFSTLQNEHVEIVRLLSALERTTADDDENDRTELFETIRRELLAHEYAEHSTLFRVLPPEQRTADAVAESKREYADLEDILYALSLADIGSADWADRLRNLVRAVQRHIAAEEGALFHTVQTIFDVSVSSDLDEEFRSEKEAEIARLQTLEDLGPTPLGE